MLYYVQHKKSQLSVAAVEERQGASRSGTSGYQIPSEGDKSCDQRIIQKLYQEES